MPVSMTVGVSSKRVDRQLQEALNGIEDLRTPFERSGTYMERSIGLRFRKANWKPLAESTIERWPKREGGKPLNDTGRLKRSVTSEANIDIKKQKMYYGTNLVYAPVHNFGYKQVPKREFLYLSQQNNKMISKIFRDYVKEVTE